jgi:Bacteriocin-protection, YdeI or OmpD-Associated/Domain of unknown function (DUF1905)
MKTTFTTKVLGMGNNTGIEVPAQNIAQLGSGKKPAVKVNANGYAYSSTVGVMGGKHLIPLSAAHRKASGLNAGDEITVTLELETEARTVELPSDLSAALEAAGTRGAFDALAPSKRKESVRQLEDAKTPETRERRLAKILEGLG